MGAHPDAIVLHTVAPVLLAVRQLTGGPHGQQVLLDRLIIHAMPQEANRQQLVLCCSPCHLPRQSLKLRLQKDSHEKRCAKQSE